jgi:hypothetical protein
VTTEELIANVSPTIGSLGSGFYFIPETLAVGKALGLDGFRWYVLGRGGVLGDVAPGVVSAAFGYFSPELITKLWDSARAIVPAREAGHRYHLCAAEYGRAKFSAVEGLAEYCAAAEKVIAAADCDGLSLFAGIAAEPLVEDLPGRAMQLTAVLRELRGSAHLVAVVATGMRARSAHFVKRPDDAKTFGYSPEDVAAGGSPDDAARLDAAERVTDLIVTRAFSVLTDAEGAALQAGVNGLKAALG